MKKGGMRGTVKGTTFRTGHAFRINRRDGVPLKLFWVVKSLHTCEGKKETAESKGWELIP